MNIIELGSIQIDIDEPVHERHSEKTLLHRILAQQKHNETILNKIMISIDALNTTASRLETDTHTIIGLLPGSTVPSTPDTDVAAFQARVDAASTAMEAAIATASSGGTPPPPPTTP